jgi:hypothetical protein
VIRKEAEQTVGHHRTDNGVAQELQPFVGDGAWMLSTPGPVGQRLDQQVGVVEPVPDTSEEPLLVGVGDRNERQRRATT